MSGGITWGEIPLHMSIIQSILHGENNNLYGLFTRPKSPIFAGSLLPISFFPHIHRASFIKAG